MKILITSGPTREFIDDVRYISNISTGETGKVLAEYFAKQGHEVTFIRGGDSLQPTGVEREISFTSFASLNDILQRILGETRWDAVIHSAAVGDYTVAEVRAGSQIFTGEIPRKIDSSESMQISLRRNFKILERVKSYAASSKPVVVGFKLTSAENKDGWWTAVQKLYAGNPVAAVPMPRVDFVVHNDLSERNGATGPQFRIFRPDGTAVECASRAELAHNLEVLIKGVPYDSRS